MYDSIETFLTGDAQQSEWVGGDQFWVLFHKNGLSTESDLASFCIYIVYIHGRTDIVSSWIIYSDVSVELYWFGILIAYNAFSSKFV